MNINLECLDPVQCEERSTGIFNNDEGKICFTIVGHSDVSFSFDWNRLLAITEKLDILRRQMWRSNAFSDSWANERHRSPRIKFKAQVIVRGV